MSKYKPPENKEYYFINEFGQIKQTINRLTIGDLWLYGFGNCFKNQEKAAAKLKEIKKILQ
jgi:hypothetical protein